MSHISSSRQISIAAGLAALSAVVQLNHIGYQSPTWGMWIDIVAVSWIVAYFIFGLRLSLIVSVMGAVVITLFAPDTWLGASMKFVATVPVIFTLYLWQKIIKNIKIEKYKNVKNILIPLLIGIAVRCAIVLPLNYYYALPIWTKMTPEAAWAAIPWYIIAGFNAVQTIVDVAIAWILVYKFRLNRYGGTTMEVGADEPKTIAQ